MTDRTRALARPDSSVLVGLLALLALVVGLLVAAATPGQAAESGRVRGAIVQQDGGTPKVKLSWFAADWSYLGARKVSGGAYSLALEPGTYYLQLADLRPSYDVTKSAPATVKVSVRAGATTVKNVRMRRGASIGGTVKAGGKSAAGARVVAANTDEQSFESTANKQGQYALGGLPPGNYSVFTYDRSGTWVAKSVYLPRVKDSAYKNLDISLGKRAGTLLVDLYAGGTTYPGSAFVTAVSRVTGQFWTAKASRGSVTFRGLYPGSYDLQVPGVGNYLPARVHVRAKVVSSKVRFGSARLSRRGGWVTGTVVDKNNPTEPLEGATVRLLDATGAQVASTTSDKAGAFTLDGQLTTQGSMTVVAGPGPYSDYLGQDTSYCKYRTGRIAGISLTTGERTDVGALPLPHLADDEQDGAQCWTVMPAPMPAPMSVRSAA